MAIVELGNSGGEHRTVDSYTATLIYHMLWEDYVNGYGDYYTATTGNVSANVNGVGGFNTGRIQLPYEGQPNTWNNDLTLTDISADILTPGTTFNGMDRVTKVTYTWSNQSRHKDSARANSAASWKLRWRGNLEYDYTDNYINTNEKASEEEPTTYLHDWANEWLTRSYDTTWTDLTGDEADKFFRRHQAEIPSLEMRHPKVFFDFTFYTDRIKDFSQYLGRINSTDHITQFYNRREAALQNQLKLRSYTVIEAIIGRERYMLVDVQHTEMSSSLHEYTLSWEENLLGWNHYDADTSDPVATPVGGINTERYIEVNFYEIVTGLDNINVVPRY